MLEKKIKKVKGQERSVLVGLITQMQNEEKSNEYLDELQFLALTAGAETIKRFTQRLTKPDNATFIGSGKLLEIKSYIKENKIDLIIFDDELSATQLRNIEKILEIKVLDRSNLILDIFASRARTSHAKTQVELAQYQYLLPRLTRLWTHLERQKGGIGMRGPGETQIETDRRIIQDKISLLKKKLVKIDKQMATQRGNRGKTVRVALVGYTNVGKSTIMNLMGKTKVFAENKLFATLDTTVRKISLQNVPFLLSDTVGFIRKLPTQLVESFKSTLDEVREADILLHVLDMAHEGFEDQYNVVCNTLNEINALDKPTIIVFNKIDAYEAMQSDMIPSEHKEHFLDELKKTWMAKMGNKNVIFLSAIKRTNVAELRKAIYEQVVLIHKDRFPYNHFYYPPIENLEEE